MCGSSYWSFFSELLLPENISFAGHAYTFLFVQSEVNRANSAADMNSSQPARQLWDLYSRNVV